MKAISIFLGFINFKSYLMSYLCPALDFNRVPHVVHWGKAQHIHKKEKNNMFRLRLNRFRTPKEMRTEIHLIETYYLWS